MGIAKEFIRVLDSAYGSIKNNILEQARKNFIDYIAVAIAGSRSLPGDFEEVAEDYKGDSFLFGTKKRSELNFAIMHNAYASHVLELDDGHREGMMHLAAPIFSALLPIAEKHNKTFRQFLSAAIVGYEAAIRMAKAIQPEHKLKGFHCTGTCGTIGCAMSVAYLLNYSYEEKLNVLSAAATSASGLLEVIMGQSQQKPYNIAHASSAGVMAALFGKALSGPEDILCGKRGFISNFAKSPKLDKLLGPVTYEILGCYFKPYAACRHCHAPIEAALLLKEQVKDVKNIESIKVCTYNLAVYGHEHKVADSVNSAKMSTPFGVATSLLWGKADIGVFIESNIVNDQLNEISSLVEVVEDEEISALVPDKRAAKVDIAMKDGKTLSKRVDYPLGEPENPILKDALKAKFCSLLMFVGVSEKNAENLFTDLSEMDYNVETKEMIKKLTI